LASSNAERAPFRNDGIVNGVREGEEEAICVGAGLRRVANEKRRGSHRRGLKRKKMLLDLEVGENATTALVTRRERKVALGP